MKSHWNKQNFTQNRAKSLKLKHEIEFSLDSYFQSQPEPDTKFNTVEPL